MITPVHSIGERLRDERMARGWSQEDVAGKVGVRSLAVGKWERGQATPTPDNRLALAKAFGIPAEEMGYETPLEFSATPPAWFVAAQEQARIRHEAVMEELGKIRRQR